MYVMAITECFRNLKQRRLSRKLQTKQLKNQVELPISPVISQLANMTFFNSSKVRTENVYDNTMLKYINKLYQTSPEKAMDMANRLKEYANLSDDYRLPRDWDYVIDIYNNDYDFIEENDNYSLSKIEALHHAQNEIPDEMKEMKYCLYKGLSARFIYPFLEMSKDYPEQVIEILRNDKYINLFECEHGKVSYSDKMKEFAEFIKDDPETMKKTMDMFIYTKRYYPTNSNSPCNLSEALKYAQMMKANPKAVTEILEEYPDAAPELLEVLVKNYDNPHLLEDFKIYNSVFNNFKIRYYENSNEWHRTHWTSVPVSETVLNDLDKFLKSGFLARLNNILLEKENDSTIRHLYKQEILADLYLYYRGPAYDKKYEYNLHDWLINKTEDYNLSYEKTGDKAYLRTILKTDPELFLRLVKDNILYIYNNRDTERIALLYKNNPNTEITWEMIHKYLSMDKEVTEAFFK